MFSDQKHNPLGRFDGLASTYSRYRPTYPAQALDWIVDKLPDRGDPIADVGAGTGILSRQLAERSCRVIGVEPNESMRQQAQSFPPSQLIDYRAGRAEATGLIDGSVGGVVAAQTFHWCDADASLREFHRILKNGGWVSLLWNIVDLTDSFTGEFWRLLQSASPEPEVLEKPHHLAGEALLSHPLFQNGDLRTAANAQELDEEGLIGRAFSASFAPKDCRASEQLAQQLRGLFHRYASGNLVRVIYRTMVYQAMRR